MLRLYELWSNNGDWGGSHSNYVIAESKEEAIEKCEYYRDRIESGCDGFVQEMTGDDLLAHFFIKEGTDYSTYPCKYKFNFEYTITEKDDK